MAKTRIRRRITINGHVQWITGATEQEYAENLFKAMSGGKARKIHRNLLDMILGDTRWTGLKYSQSPTSTAQQPSPMKGNSKSTSCPPLTVMR